MFLLVRMQDEIWSACRVQDCVCSLSSVHWQPDPLPVVAGELMPAVGQPSTASSVAGLWLCGSGSIRLPQPTNLPLLQGTPSPLQVQALQSNT